MTDTARTETVHAGCVAIDGKGVLLFGASGSGKSDLALRLLDRGARLVSDDYTDLTAADGILRATPPLTIAGMIEVRGLGILSWNHIPSAAVHLAVTLDAPVPRMAENPLATRAIAGIAIPMITLSPLEASTPIKVELALRGLPPDGHIFS